MAVPTDSVRVDQLGGIDQRWRPRPSQAAVVRDLERSPRGGWRDSVGYREITPDYLDQQGDPVNAFDDHGAVTSLHWFADGVGGLQWMLWETSDGELLVFNGSGGASDPWNIVRDAEGNQFNGSERARAYIDSPNFGTQSQTWGDNLYLVNGIDDPLVYNGRYVERAGFVAPPSAPSASIVRFGASSPAGATFGTTQTNLGLGSTSGGTAKECGYRWKVGYMNERGQESPTSAPSAILSWSQSIREFARVVIPTGPPQTVARVLYRTRDLLDSEGQPISLGEGEVFYFHSVIPDNITTVIEDGVPDNSLGSLLVEDDYGAWPDGAAIIAEFKGCMFAAAQGSNLLLYSRAAQPEVFPRGFVIPMADSSGGPITAMRATRNALVVFRQRSIHLVRGDPASGFYADTLTTETGCVSPCTVREVPNQGLGFLGTDGVWLLRMSLDGDGSGTSTIKLSEPLPGWMERLNRSALANARAEIVSSRDEYWLAVPVDGSADNNLVLRFNYIVGQWAYSEDWPIGAMVSTRDHRNYLFFGANAAATLPGVHVVSRGWDDKGGVSLAPAYETAPIAIGDLFGSLPLHRVTTFMVAAGDNEVTFNVRMNRFYDLSLTAEAMEDNTAGLQVEQQEQRRRYPVFGSTLLPDESEKWGEYRPVAVPFNVSLKHAAPAQEVQLRWEATGRRIELVGYEFEVPRGASRKVRPLDTALAVEGY